MPQVGDVFPSYTTNSHTGQTISLPDSAKGKNLVLFFYPRASTSGCVRETTEFGARESEFSQLNTTIMGVSVDEAEANQKHAITCASSFPLLSDIEGKLATELGILNPERGTAKRTTFILDKEGKVKQIFNDVTVDGHVDQVLQAVKQL